MWDRAALLSISILCGLIGTAAAETGNWPVPPQNTVEGCQGSGSPRDIGAPLEVQVRDQFGPYRGDQVVMISDLAGKPLVTLACDGPLDQFRLQPGSYRVQAFVGNVRSAEVAINVPPGGTSVALTIMPAPNQTFDSLNLG
jgi:hypothetical protein